VRFGSLRDRVHAVGLPRAGRVPRSSRSSVGRPRAPEQPHQA
jgi:hypothetical protein